VFCPNMILRCKGACAIFFLSLTTVISKNCKRKQFSLSLQEKADYEQAISRCIRDSDTYRVHVNGEPRTELDISTCQLEGYLRALQNSADGDLQLSNIFKALDQNQNGQLSLCDLVFGAEELKKEFITLDTMFNGDSQEKDKMETKTDILSLVKVVDDQCDVSCHVCPETLCIMKEECAYNVHLGCFQTHQPTLTPTDLKSLSEIKTEDPSEVSANVRKNFTLNSGPGQYNQIAVFTTGTSKFIEMLVGTSIIIWIVLVVYLIRNRKCKCKLCGSYRAPCTIERNMYQGLIGLENPVCVGECSEGGETSGYESTACNERVCIEGDNMPGSIRKDGSTSSLQRSCSTASSSILVGGPFILDRIEPARSIRKSRRNAFVEKNQSFEKNKRQANLKHADNVNVAEPRACNSRAASKTDNNLEPSRYLPTVAKRPRVVTVDDVEDNLQNGHKMRSLSFEKFQVSRAVALAPAMEKVDDIKMDHMVGAFSSDSSGYSC